jgi:type VI secretion system secreted protein Hcp
MQMAQIDTHIKFDGVEGEATHKDHKGEIELLSWSWGVTNHSGTAGGGSGVGKGTPGELSFTHRFDKASTVLAKKCAGGVHFKEVILTARKAGDGQKDFLKIIMKEAFIIAVNASGGSGGEIMENVSMTYGDIGIAYKPQDEKGALTGEVKFGWNVKTTEVT